MALSGNTEGTVKFGVAAVLSILFAFALSAGVAMEFWNMTLSLVVSSFFGSMILNYLAALSLNVAGQKENVSAIHASMKDVVSSLKVSCDHLGNSAWNLDKLVKLTNFGNTKLGYIERRIDQAQASIRDVLRHVQQQIVEFLPGNSPLSVLQKWVSAERDRWLQRRSAQAWLFLTAAVVANIRNEICWLRINKKENAQDTARWLQNISRLAHVYSFWQTEANPGEMTLEQHSELQPVVEADRLNNQPANDSTS